MDDLIATQSFVISKSKFHKTTKLIGSIVVFIVSMVFISLIFKDLYVMIFLGSLILSYVTYNFIYEKAMNDQTKRLVKRDPTLINVECKLTISEDGLLREFKNSTNKLEWSEIKLLGEDDDRYILYLSDIKTIVIKKKPYNMSEEEIQTFNQLLRSYFFQYNIAIE